MLTKSQCRIPQSHHTSHAADAFTSRSRCAFYIFAFLIHLPSPHPFLTAGAFIPYIITRNKSPSCFTPQQRIVAYSYEPGRTARRGAPPDSSAGAQEQPVPHYTRTRRPHCHQYRPLQWKENHPLGGYPAGV